MISKEGKADERQVVDISGHNINLKHVEQILLSNGGVMDAQVTTLREGGNTTFLLASVTLKKGITPSNDLKNELAWLVAADLGVDVPLKDIELKKDASEMKKQPIETPTKREVLHISGHEISMTEVKHALEEHESVMTATVMCVEDARKGSLLKANVSLNEGVSKTNDLKSELAWHVQSIVGPMVIFKDIEFNGLLPEEVEQNESTASTAQCSMMIVDGVGDEGRSMHISTHRISTTEVTLALLRHPDVEDAAVVTIPDEEKGETMKAFVKVKNGVEPSNDLKLELAWHVMAELKPIAVFQSVELESHKSSIPTTPERQKGIKEQVYISGHTILSSEVERVLETHNSVVSAIVIGVPDDKHGEALQAYVTLEQGIAASDELMEELAWHARTEIGPSVVFKSVKFLKYLPHADDRQTLRSIIWADALNIPAKISITVAD